MILGDISKIVPDPDKILEVRDLKVGYIEKEGIDEDGITFHNAGGALGLRQPNAFFEGKEVMVNRLKQYALIPMTRLDVSALVTQKADIEKVNIFPDEDNNYAIYVKARNEKAITMSRSWAAARLRRYTHPLRP